MELKNFDKLVKSISSNILEKLDIKTDKKYDKSILILVPNIGFGMKDYMSYIKARFPGYNLIVGMDKPLSSAQKGDNNLVHYVALDFNDVDFLSILDCVDMIIVLGLKISQMKTLIETDDAQDVNHLILGSLMANKPITIMLNTNAVMYQKISSIITDIQEMGIHVVNIQKSKQTKRTNKDLITESYVVDLGKSGSKELHLHEKQLITPLAKDKLRELQIKIKYVKEDN